MVEVKDKALCCGCTSCASICPHDAIRMKPDAMGFKYPVVDVEKCTDCGLCEIVCDFVAPKSCEVELPVHYAVRHKDEAHLMTSRSGGAFIALSDAVLAVGGVVYGASFNEDFTVSHKRAENSDERDLFKGSKYVQSDLGDIFRQVRDDLIHGRQVLFSGTSCQVAGLRSFLKGRFEDLLYCVDVVCHGVPSPAVWKSYLEYMSSTEKASLKRVEFRDKLHFGWSDHKESFIFSDGTIKYGDVFRHLFYKHLILRPSCGECLYTVTAGSSDVTIADFWGIEQVDPDFNADNKGCSLVFCRTPRGNELFARSSDSLFVRDVHIDMDFLKRFNPPAVGSVELSEESSDFAEVFEKRGFRVAIRRWGNKGFRYRIRSILRRIIKV